MRTSEASCWRSVFVSVGMCSSRIAHCAKVVILNSDAACEHGMRNRLRKFVIELGLICSCLPAVAQVDQFLPEVNFYSKLSSGTRIQVQAKQTREGGEQVQAEVGYGWPSLRSSISMMQNRGH